MNRIISYSCLVWLVYVSVAASEQADQHHEDPMVMVTKEVDTKPRGTDGEEDKKELSALDLKERKMDWDSSFESGSSEEEGMKDRGLFDGGLFGGGYGKQRRRNGGGMFSPSSFSGGYGGGRGRGRAGRSPYGQQFYEDPRYGMGYGNGGFGGSYPDRRFSMQQPYPNRYMPYSGGRGGGRQFRGGFPGEGGFYGQQPSYRQPYYRDLQPEPTIPVEPVAAR